MKTSRPLGRLERVPLRDHWANEESDFTPWLAQEDNIAILGETLGLSLVVEQTEMNVGDFRADIVCRDDDTGEVVLVENQLEKTDHTHLGQVLTYAAGLDALTIVWIAARVREEHRATLDWLNRITDGSFNFFGLEVELLKIGDSPPAPHFTVAAKPNNWKKTIGRSGANQDKWTVTEQLRFAFWEAFGEFLDNGTSRFKPPKPRKDVWVSYGLGGKGIYLEPVIRLSSAEMEIRIEITGEDGRAHFHLLHDQKKEIEKELGFALEWREKPGKTQTVHLLAPKKVGDPGKKERWPTVFAWILEKLLVLDGALRPRVARLDAADWEPDESLL